MLDETGLERERRKMLQRQRRGVLEQENRGGGTKARVTCSIRHAPLVFRGG